MAYIPSLPGLTRCVNRSFRKVEKAADWFVGKAGPFFIAICITLVAIGAWTFFILLLPSFLTPPSQLSFSIPSIASVLFTCYCLYIIYSIAWFYYSACTIPPGNVSSFVSAAADLASTQGSPQDLEEDEDAQGAFLTAYLSRIDSRWASYAERARSASRWVSDAHDASIQDYLAYMRNVRGKNEEEIEEEDLWPRVKMCLKCDPVPLWWAMACLPEELRAVEKLRRTRADAAEGQANQSISPPSDHSQDSRPSSVYLPPSTSAALPWTRSSASHLREVICTWLPASEADTLVPPPKPERTHHCSVCKTCIIKYDHHCPWLNQCVGLYNERFFVGFLAYMIVGCMTVLLVGWRKAWEAVKIWERWPYSSTPRYFVLLTYILCFAMGLALLIMLAGHLDMVSRNLTSVESSDREFYLARAKAHHKEMRKRQDGNKDGNKGKETESVKKAEAREVERAWGNVYDVGTRRRNLSLFFNVGKCSSSSSGATSPSSASTGAAREGIKARRRPLYYALLPIRYPPHSDGWHWPKRRGTGGKGMLGVGTGEEVEFSGDELAEDGEGEEGEHDPTHHHHHHHQGQRGKRRETKSENKSARRRLKEREILAVAGSGFGGTQEVVEMH